MYTATIGVWYIFVLPLALYVACIGAFASDSVWRRSEPHPRYPFIVTAIIVTAQTAAPFSSIFALLRLARLTLANFAITASLNILITALISIRLILHRIKVKKTLGSDLESLTIYTSVSSILAESSALYSTFSLMFIVTYGIGHPSGLMFLPMLGQIQVCTCNARQHVTCNCEYLITLTNYIGCCPSPGGI